MKTSKLTIRPCRSSSRLARAPKVRLAPGDEAGEVARVGAEEGVGDLGAEAACRAAVEEGVVDPFGAGLSFHLGKLRRVFGGARLAGESFAVAFEQAAEVGAHRRLQRRQHLVELNRYRGAADRDRAATVHLGRAGAARVEVDEEVALEEDPRSDLGVGVAVDRTALLFDGEGDGRGAAVAARLDHFADVDAGDPHRRIDRDIGGVGEGRLQLVAVAGEGHVFGERQVGPEGEDQDEDQRDRRVARSPAEAAVLGALPGVSLG